MKEIVYTFWKNRDINDLEGEVWKDIPNTDGFYQASNLGRIKSFIRRYYYTYEDGKLIKNTIPLILKQTVKKNGYLAVGIKFNTGRTYLAKSVHRIICSVFKQEVKNKPLVHHKKNVRTLNTLRNLEWVSHEENMDFKKTDHGNYEIIDVEVESNAPNVPEGSLYKKGFIYIYGIVDDYNKVVYVGKSEDPHHRFRGHKATKIWHGKPYWMQDFIKSGQSMDFIILKLCADQEWIKWEKHFISKYRKINKELKNIAHGGFNNSQESINKSAKNRWKKVLQYSRDGIFIKEWSSLKSAAEFIGIVACGLSGTIKYRNISANSFWVYKKGDNIPLQITPDDSFKNLPVLQYSLNGIFIKEWVSAKDVERHNPKLKAGAIYACIRSDIKSSFGFRWKLKTEDVATDIGNHHVIRTFKPIYQVLDNGERILHKSIKDAALSLNITSAHITESMRNNKKAGGFYFEKDLSNPIWLNPHGRLSK